MQILRNELIFQPSEGVQCHASHIALLPDGGAFAVWFQGTREGADDVRIWGARLPKEGHWEQPAPLTPDNGLPHWNPVLHLRQDGVLLLFYKEGRVIADWHTMAMRSADWGRSWSEPEELVPGDVGGRGPVRNKILVLPDGALLAPASLEKGEWRCFMDRSEDGGASWSRTADIRIPRPKSEVPTPFGAIQPTLWRDDKGVHALLRTTQGALYRADSADEGWSWCEPYATSMPNNNSGVDVGCAPDGTLYLVCNPVGGNWAARSPISVFVSKDGGTKWELLTHLVTMPGEYSYPAVLWQDGVLHITHTWQRRSICYWQLRLK